MFIDASYFVGELSIPNTESQGVQERINFFIKKYESIFLQDLLGYSLYKALIAGLNVTPPTLPDQRYLDILFGAEYTDMQGNLQKWKGLIVNDSATYNVNGNYAYHKPSYMKAGTTPGLVPGQSVAVFDGQNGTENLIGWEVIAFRSTIMQPGIHYSWDSETGTFTLLVSGDLFGVNEYFTFEFLSRLIPTGSTSDEPGTSLIANYIYYWYIRTGTTQTTGIGEVITLAENSLNANPRKKLASVWNEMHFWVEEFICFMETMAINQPTKYPEWTYNSKYVALMKYAFVNPIY